jgi:hypothetical protein
MKKKRKITYKSYCRKYYGSIEYPCLIFSGKWMRDKYCLEIGDTVEVMYLSDKIVIKPNNNHE